MRLMADGGPVEFPGMVWGGCYPRQGYVGSGGALIGPLVGLRSRSREDGKTVEGILVMTALVFNVRFQSDQ